MLIKNIFKLGRTKVKIYIFQIFSYFQDLLAIILQTEQAHFHPWSFLKVHKHEFFVLTFFAETETLWSQGPVTRDF
jgi:hypothetical protein